jgi:hypothetical protein
MGILDQLAEEGTSLTVLSLGLHVIVARTVNIDH